jgi:hypothetical protein
MSAQFFILSAEVIVLKKFDINGQTLQKYMLLTSSLKICQIHVKAGAAKIHTITLPGLTRIPKFVNISKRKKLQYSSAYKFTHNSADCPVLLVLYHPVSLPL